MSLKPARVGAERPGECALVARPLVLHGAARRRHGAFPSKRASYLLTTYWSESTLSS